MKKTFSVIVWVMIATMVLAGLTPTIADQNPPVLPQSFYGELYIGGNPAAAGTEVEARGEGVLTGVEGNSIVTTAPGKYGDYATSDFLIVQGDIQEGTDISFYVNGVQVEQPPVPFERGAITELYLSCVTSPPPPEYSSNPLPPHTFFGTVTINGSPAPAGTQIKVTGDGILSNVEGNPITLQTAGTFGMGWSSPKLYVQGNGSATPGVPLTFYVNNIEMDVEPSIVWTPGAIHRIDFYMYPGDSSGGSGPGGGGSGGGGGGGGTGVAGDQENEEDFFFSSQTRLWLADAVTMTGLLARDLSLMSWDGKVRITLYRGTAARNSTGQILPALSMESLPDPPAPPSGSNIVGLYYNLLPDGATFEPPIELVFYYDEDDIPEEVAEEDLVLAYYDVNSGTWVELSGEVDTDANTITAMVSHFCCFAVLAHSIETSAPGPSTEPSAGPDSSVPPSGPVPGPVPAPASPAEVEPAPAPAPSTPSTDKPVRQDEQPSSGNSWGIIGGATGILLLGVAVYLAMRNREQRKDSPPDGDMSS